MVELMIVVSIIGITSAMAASSVGDAFSENRASRAARELVRVGRRARSDAMGYLRAYMVWVEVEGTTNRVSLIRGWSSSCTSENWAGRLGAAACGALTAPCVERVDFAASPYSNDGYPARIDLNAGTAPTARNVAICYTPSGRMYSQRTTLLNAVTPASFTSDNVLNSGGLRFWVRRMDGSVQRGVQRFVFFPQGAPPRLER